MGLVMMTRRTTRLLINEIIFLIRFVYSILLEIRAGLNLCVHL